MSDVRRKPRIWKNRYPIVPEAPWMITHQAEGESPGVEATVGLHATWRGAVDWLIGAYRVFDEWHPEGWSYDWTTMTWRQP